MDYKIKKLKTKDYKQADKLLLKLHQLHIDNRPDIFKEVQHSYTKKEWNKRIKSKNYIYWGIFDNNKLIGIIGLSLLEFNSIIIPTISCIYVLEEYRKQKIAKKLMNKVKKYCKNHLTNSKKKISNFIELDVMDFNESAIAFYKEMDFNFKCHIMEYKFKK